MASARPVPFFLFATISGADRLHSPIPHLTLPKV